MSWKYLVLTGAAAVAAACGARAPDESLIAAEKPLRVQSVAFGEGGSMPTRYTFDGANVSPPLSWTAGPRDTVTYALVMDDSAAPGGFVNWVIWNIPGAQLEEDVRPIPVLPSGAVQGKNSSARTGYSGPQPAVGTTHTYFIRVFALDTRLDLPPSANRDLLDAAMRGHVIAQGRLSVRYARTR
jgi:Raf kinase inhibitor-like YbhB/YbcL family protein